MKKVPTLVIVLREDQEEKNGYWNYCYFEWDFRPAEGDLRHFRLRMPEYRLFRHTYNQALEAWYKLFNTLGEEELGLMYGTFEHTIEAGVMNDWSGVPPHIIHPQFTELHARCEQINAINPNAFREIRKALYKFGCDHPNPIVAPTRSRAPNQLSKSALKRIFYFF